MCSVASYLLIYLLAFSEPGNRSIACNGIDGDKGEGSEEVRPVRSVRRTEGQGGRK